MLEQWVRERNTTIARLFHLLGDHPRDVAAASVLIRSGAIAVLPIGDDDLEEIETLMKRYADRSMDVADATLVRLAEREQLTGVFTIDHDDFETYRIGARRRFRIAPARR